MRLGLVARMDRTGLGQGQTLRLARLLSPHLTMVINSNPFNKNEQFPVWYHDYNSMWVDGFPGDSQVRDFLQYVDVVISCETFYNNNFTYIAKEMGVKTILIANYEFFDWHAITYRARNPLPDKILTPSYWHLEEMQRRFDAEYLPTPIFEDEFKQARKVNLKRKGQVKFLFIEGTTAAEDRSGLQSFYSALQLSKEDYTVTIKSQKPIPKHPDPRLIYDSSNPVNTEELYEGFDCLIHPRRYSGQSLGLMEALSSGLPVIGLDREPENVMLPREWLIPASVTNSFMTRTKVDIYTANIYAFANKLDSLKINRQDKLKAIEISRQYDAEVLRPQYEKLLERI